jgi:hypothetical protein
MILVIPMVNDEQNHPTLAAASLSGLSGTVSILLSS